MSDGIIAAQFRAIYYASDAFEYLVGELLKSHPGVTGNASEFGLIFGWCNSHGLDLGSNPDCTSTCLQVLREGVDNIWPGRENRS